MSHLRLAPPDPLDRLRRANALLAAYRDINEALLGCEALPSAVEKLLRHLTALFGAEGGAVLLRETDSAPLTTFGWPSDRWAQIAQRAQPALLVAAERAGPPVGRVRDADTPPPSERAGVRGIDSELLIALELRGEPLGAVLLFNFFYPEHLDRYGLEAAPLALPISQGLSRIQLEAARRRETRLLQTLLAATRRHEQRSSLLASAAAHLISDEGPEEVLRQICERLRQELALDLSVCCLTSETGLRPSLPSCHGLTPTEARELGCLRGPCAAPACAANLERRCVLEDVQHSSDPRAVGIQPLGVTAYVCHPLIARGEMVGTLSFGSHQRTGFDPDELELMQTLCDQLATTVDRAGLVCELQRRAAELGAASRRKDEFIGMLSHELRNPVAAIDGAVQLLGRSCGNGVAFGQAHDIASRQIRHMASLLDDLLDVSRITRGKIALRRQPLDLAGAVAKAVDSQAASARAQNLQLLSSFSPGPLPIDADPHRLEQIVGNLLHNAVKYTPDGGRIWISVRREQDEAVLSVRDTGIGMAADLLPQIFDLFVQADRSLDRARGGLGIGLYLVRHLVELHGGRVEAYSDGPGRGSELVVRLPVLPPNAETAAPNTAPAATGPVLARRVLVVDDNEDAAATLALLLELEGHQVQVAHDGEAAIELALRERPDVVLLDIGMPRMDGYEAGRRMRREPALDRTLLVALTGFGQETDRARAREVGFDHHLVKPAKPEALRELLALAPARGP